MATTYNKKYYDENKDKVQASHKRYYDKNKDTLSKKNAERAKAKRDTKRSKIVKVCPRCGCKFTPVRRGNQKYCSKECYKANSWSRLKETSYYKSGKYKIAHRNAAYKYWTKNFKKDVANKPKVQVDIEIL